MTAKLHHLITHPDRYPEKQMRLLVGPYQLLRANQENQNSGPWALPGGGKATTSDMMGLASREGWPLPRVVEVDVWHTPMGAA